MPLVTDSAIARVLADTRRIALLGASDKPQRPSYRVFEFLLAHGYEVFPVNPGLEGQTLLGRLVYACLADVPAPVDMIDVFRHSRYLPEVVEEAIVAGTATLWTQLGVVDTTAIANAERAGLQVVADRCPAIEWPRLRSAGLIQAVPH